MELKLIHKFLAHRGAVYALCPAGDSKTFFSAGSDGMVAKWDIENFLSPVAVAKVEGAVFSLEYLPEENFLLVGQMKGGLHVMDLKNKSEIRHLAWHKNGLFDVKIHRKSKRIFLAGGDGAVSSWDGNTFVTIAVSVLSEKSIRTLELHPAEEWLAAGSSDHHIYLVDINTLKTEKVLTGHKNSIFSLRFTPDGRYLLSGSRDAHLGIWDCENDFKLVDYLPIHYSTVNDIAFHPNENLYATASRDKSIKIWGLKEYNFVTKTEPGPQSHTHSVNRILWMPGKTLVSGGDDHSVALWNLI